MKKSHSTYESFIPLKENKGHRRAGSSDAISTLNDGTEIEIPPKIDNDEDDEEEDNDQIENNNDNDMDDVNNTLETDRSNGNDIEVDAVQEDIYGSGANGTNHVDTETEPNQNDDSNHLDSQVSGYRRSIAFCAKKNNFSPTRVFRIRY